jgi:small subunit ribosomal protein S11
MVVFNKKQKKVIKSGIINIKTTFNNTIVTVSDLGGNTFCWASSGTAGFKGTKKNTPFAAQLVGRDAALKALEFGLEKVKIIVKGRGNGRETAIRAIKASGLIILSIEDKTSLPHNGCRAPKKRRL